MGVFFKMVEPPIQQNYITLPYIKGITEVDYPPYSEQMDADNDIIAHEQT